jgi:transposase-like protein
MEFIMTLTTLWICGGTILALGIVVCLLWRAWGTALNELADVTERFEGKAQMVRYLIDNVTEEVAQRVKVERKCREADAERDRQVRRACHFENLATKKGKQVADLIEQSVTTQQYSQKGDILIDRLRMRLEEEQVTTAAKALRIRQLNRELDDKNEIILRARTEVIRLNMELNPLSGTVYRSKLFVETDYCVGYDGFLAAVDRKGNWTGCPNVSQEDAEEFVASGAWQKFTRVRFDKEAKECLDSKPKRKASRKPRRKSPTK